MQRLIEQIRMAIPFKLAAEEVCGESCQGCSSKLLIYLETELDEWESRLVDGEIPTFGDLERMAKQSRKIYRILQQNALVAARDTD